MILKAYPVVLLNGYKYKFDKKHSFVFAKLASFKILVPDPILVSGYIHEKHCGMCSAVNPASAPQKETTELGWALLGSGPLCPSLYG